MDVEIPDEFNSSFNSQTQTGLFYFDKTETGSKWYFDIVLK